VILAVAVGILLNRQWLYDYFRGVQYRPSEEMSIIRDSLQLTDQGKFLFNAAQPELEEKDVFNAYCRMGDEEIAILGCYTSGNIYIYNIIDKELDGIRELTTAHELLHAVFARMSEGDKSSLKQALDKVYTENKDTLEKDLDSYDEEEQFEELYVRAGTEIKKLPEILEKHYATIFSNQDKVVDYYNKYIAVFRVIKADFDRLTDEMENLDQEIKQKTSDYESRAGQLNTEIANFNACAETEGCFVNEYEFWVRRNNLVNEQVALDGLYEEINTLIDQYNTDVEKYNENVIRNDKLNSIINSSAKVEAIE
jgi:hypothetical protein